MIRVNILTGTGKEYIEFDCPKYLTLEEINTAIERLQSAKQELIRRAKRHNKD